MHITGTDRADGKPAILLPEREGHEDRSTLGITSHRDVTRLLPRVPHIRRNPRRPQHLLDFFPGHAMLAAFRPIPGIPIETCDLHFSLRLCVDKSKTNPHGVRSVMMAGSQAGGQIAKLR
jgi:hypothetical protein